MNNVVAVYKPIGESPVGLIKKFKTKFPKYKDETVSYAGRLDPLAHGVMILLIGDENKNRRKYEQGDKTYSFTYILGIATDSYDICGLPTLGATNNALLTHLNELTPKLIGQQQQSFPPFSSYKIKGKPLFKYARDGKLDDIEIPSKEIEVYSLELLETETISSSKLHTIVTERISMIQGDFRQEEILNEWNQLLQTEYTFSIITMKARVSAGTYIRGIVHSIGETLGCGAVTLEIHRIESNGFTLDDCIHLDI